MMMGVYEDILTELFGILKPYVEGELELGEGTDLVADIGLDSMHVMNLLLEVEDRFDVSIPLNVIADVRTIGDFALQLKVLTGDRA
jgi:acyl carrier protein